MPVIIKLKLIIVCRVSIKTHLSQETYIPNICIFPNCGNSHTNIYYEQESTNIETFRGKDRK